jgi:hypothetical protein
MATKNKSGLLVYLFLFTAGVLLVPFVSSCGKGANATASGLNTQLQILNLSPDAQPLILYLDNIQQSTTTYTYPTSSGYFYLSTLIAPFQMRTATTTSTIVLQIDSTLKINSKYTLFITGYRADNSIARSILTLDTATLPTIGKGKIRFIHTSPSSPTLDMRINDTLAFSNIAFDSLSKYIQVPAGTYTFTINAHSTPTKIETSVSNVTIKDGLVYTVYTQGVVGRTDSVAFGAGVLTNNLLIKSTQ